MSHVVYKASSILQQQQENTFQDKGFEARLSTLTCWLKKYDYVYRMKTRGHEVPGGGLQGGDHVHGHESPISL